MDITPYLGPIVTIVIAVVTAYVATNAANNRKFEEIKVQNAEQTAMLKALKEQVEKHNQVVERTFKLETEMSTAFRRIDELRERDEHIETKMEKLHKIGGTD